MWTHAIAALVTSFVVATGGFFVAPAHAQVKPAVQDVAVNPIGKVVVATGSVTIEHVNAVVVQVNTPQSSRRDESW